MQYCLAKFIEHFKVFYDSNDSDTFIYLFEEFIEEFKITKKGSADYIIIESSPIMSQTRDLQDVVKKKIDSVRGKKFYNDKFKSLIDSLCHIEVNLLEDNSESVNQNKFKLSDLRHRIINDLTKDKNVSQDTVDTLSSIKEDYVFLTESFIYSCNQPNKKNYLNSTTEDNLLLIENSNICPLCAKDLIIKKGGGYTNNYLITNVFPINIKPSEVGSYTSIFPKPIDVDSNDNKIALCKKCSSDYEIYPTTTKYKRLFEIKKTCLDNSKIEEIMNHSDLTDNIKFIIGKMHVFKDKTDEELVMNPVEIVNKILPENNVLFSTVKMYVRNYYLEIREEFTKASKLGYIDFELICKNVKDFYITISKVSDDQNDIFQKIKKWFMHKLSLTQTYDLSCGILTAFFIQNCEVFDVIS